MCTIASDSPFVALSGHGTIGYSRSTMLLVAEALPGTNSSRAPSLSTTESKLWHKRLAHLHTAAMKSVIDGYTHENDDICEICIWPSTRGRLSGFRSKGPRPLMSLSTQTSVVRSPRNRSATASILSLSSMIVRAIPMPTSSATNNRRPCASAFQLFQAKVDSIKRFRCDNGSGEYNNRLFRGIRASYMSRHPRTLNIRAVLPSG